MIVVDASALLAVLLEEPEGPAFKERMLASPTIMSPVNFWEASVRAQALDGPGGRRSLEDLVSALGIDIAAMDGDAARTAADAFAQYGRRTPANLNLGDCFAYALAKRLNVPLLFKGDDFAETDVTAA